MGAREGTTSRVVVVGAGIAGLVAAVRAAELGAQVTVLEAGDVDRYPANSRYTGGVFHLAFHDITSSPAELLDAIRRTGDGVTRDDLAQVLAEEAGPSVAWLSDHGAAFGHGGDHPWMSRMLVPLSLQEPGFQNHWPDKGAERLLIALERNLDELGGQLLRGVRAKRLLGDANRVRGLIGISAGNSELRFDADAVILADGGFQGNDELVSRYISPDPSRLCRRGARSGMGDGLVMAQAVGTAFTALDKFYGHVQCSRAVHDDKLWPYPIMDLLTSSAIVVDGNGRRFADEGLGGVSMANAIAKLDDPLSSFLIMDYTIWDTRGRDFLLPPNPTIQERGAEIYSASSVEELASKIGIPGDDLARTISAYNEAVSRGSTSDLQPPRTDAAATLAASPLRVESAPFMAVRLAAGITYTMGGIAIDANARVLHESGEVIPGLYAAGSTTGGFEGGPSAVYLGGLAKAAIFGLRAGESAAQEPTVPVL